MIRMGRSSKNENTGSASETTELYEQSAAATSFPFSNSNPPRTAGGALSESESMARDIKEGRLSGFVGAGTVLTGETNFQSMLRVDGHLKGRVTSSDGTLIIGSTGQVDANIDVAAAVINGTVNGDIIATEKLELGRSAHVVGNIQAPRLLVEDGAILEGSCSMIQSKEDFDQKIAQEKERLSTNELPAFTAEDAAAGYEAEELYDEDETSDETLADREESADAAVR